MSRRYTLRNPELLQGLMGSPGTGVPYTIRSFARAIGRSRGYVEGLLNGRLKAVSVDDAHRIVDALGVAPLVLFLPSTTPNQDALTTKTIPPSKE